MKRTTLFSTLFILSCAIPLFADDAPVVDESVQTKYVLKYRFEPGETIRYRVEHRATVDTKIEDNRDVSKSRSVSTKAWKVDSVDGKVITFSFFIEDVDMWQKSEGQDEIRYSSANHQGEIPAQYKHVASTVGKTLAVVTVSDTGTIIKREKGKSNPDLGFGGIIFPLPKGEIEVGHTWSQPKTLKLNQRDGRVKQVNVQVKHKLEQVRRGIATISIRTEVLTPLTSATLKSQLVQQLSNGKVEFDIKNGRVLAKELQWDETVIGFNGPSSNMKYLAKFTESLVNETRTASKSGTVQ